MPMIRITVPAGAVPAESGRGVQAEPAPVLLRRQGAPDTTCLREEAWSYLSESAQIAAPDQAHALFPSRLDHA